MDQFDVARLPAIVEPRLQGAVHEGAEKMIVPHIDHQLKRLLALPAPDQIGIAVRSIEKSIRAYSDLFGWGPFEVFEPNYSEQIYRGRPGREPRRAAAPISGLTEMGTR